MKQLLVWCGRRALDGLGDAPPVPPPLQGSSGGVDQSARHIGRCWLDLYLLGQLADHLALLGCSTVDS